MPSMILVAEAFSLTLPEVIMPLALLVGFGVSVAIGVWFAWTRWREHQAQTTCKKCGADLGVTPERCPRCGESQLDAITAPPASKHDAT